MNTMRDLVKKLGMFSAKGLRQPYVMPGKQLRQLKQYKKLLQWFRKYNSKKVTMWKDEKLSLVEHHHNRHNDMFIAPVRAVDQSVRLVRWGKYPDKVMTIGMVASDSSVMDPLIFTLDLYSADIGQEAEALVYRLIQQFPYKM